MGRSWKHLMFLYLVLLLVTVEPRYLNLFTWVITWPAFSMSWPMSWDPWGNWYITCFLEVNFQPKCLWKFWEIGDYFLCILVLVCIKGNVISKHGLMYQNISGHFFLDFNWLALNRFASCLLCIHTYWVELVKESEKTIENMSEDHKAVSGRLIMLKFQLDNSRYCTLIAANALTMTNNPPHTPKKKFLQPDLHAFPNADYHRS